MSELSTVWLVFEYMRNEGIQSVEVFTSQRAAKAYVIIASKSAASEDWFYAEERTLYN